MDRIAGWLSSVLGSRAQLQFVEPLQGGISSSVYGLRLGDGTELVLRQFTDRQWLAREPDLAVREAAALQSARRIGIPTPELIAYDETGSECGMPTVLMTRLRGEVILQPPDMDEWLGGLAESLSAIHAADAQPESTYYTYADVRRLNIPAWSGRPRLWGRALDIVRGPAPAFRSCFIHRDYHPANVLWADKAVSGVVDWVNACAGPPGIDVGHCRLNLALLYGMEAADRFLELYAQRMEEHYTHHPYWDLITVIEWLPGPPVVYAGWIDLGMGGLTDGLMAERMEQYVSHLVSCTTG